METPDLKKATEQAQATAAEVADETKLPWQSSTMWAALIMAVVPLFPPAASLVAAHPEIVGLAAGALVAGLRMITSKKVVLKKG